jgi:ribosome maturation factor RimP
MVDVDTIVRVLAPAVTDLGLDLYDVDVTGSGRARILRVMVDREGGVDLEAIAAATQAVSPLLDAPPLDAVIPGPYALEVSSPGLERPLRTPAHFARAVGETVSVKTRASDTHGPRRERGVVTAADDAGFDLTLDDATVQRVAYENLTQAHTVFEWGDADSSKTGKSNSKSGSKSKSAAPKRSNSRREPVRR